MKLSTVIVGLLLAFLLSTPQGRFIGEAVLLKAIAPAPGPVAVATEKACDAKQKASSQKAKEVAERFPIPGFDPNAANRYKLPPC